MQFFKTLRSKKFFTPKLLKSYFCQFYSVITSRNLRVWWSELKSSSQFFQTLYWIAEKIYFTLNYLKLTKTSRLKLEWIWNTIKVTFRVIFCMEEISRFFSWLIQLLLLLLLNPINLEETFASLNTVKKS